MNDDDKNHILSNLTEKNLTIEPFTYFIFNNFFSNDYYQKLLLMKPLDEQYKDTDPNRTSNKFALNYRRRFNLVSDLNYLDDERKKFWREFTAFFISPKFLSNLFKLCEKSLIERYKINNLNKLNVEVRIELIRDTGGYMIAPHTDSPKKIFTILMYIPDNNNFLELGTSLFIPKEKNFTSEKATQYDFKFFDEIKKMPFKKNFTFGFLKSEKSFHGRHPIDKEFKGHRDWINFSIQHRNI